MRKILLVTIMVINASTTADAHCYTRWYYPYPQKCGGIYTRTNYRPTVVHRVNSGPTIPVDVRYDIPIPDLDGTWINETETPEQLQLMENMERLRALRSLSTN